MKPLLPWTGSNKYLSECACSRWLMRACCVPGRISVCTCLRECSSAYLACNARAPCSIVVRGLSGSAKLFYVNSKTARISKKKCVELLVLVFSISFINNISHSKKGSGSYYPKYENVFM